MKTPEWLKSNARKVREAAAAAEKERQEEIARIARQENRKREYEANVAAANTPDKLAESGVAVLVDLIKNYKNVHIKGDKWWFGNIVFDANYYLVSYYEGFARTHLFAVPVLQYKVVEESVAERLEKMRPVKAELSKIYDDIEQRKKGLADKKAIEELECEYDRRRRDVFMRLAQETLERNK